MPLIPNSPRRSFPPIPNCFFLLLLLLSPFSAHAEEKALPGAAAKTRLERLKLSFTPEVFIDEIRRGEIEPVKLFLDAGMPAITQDASGRPALSWAAGNGHVPLVKLLLEKGAELCNAGAWAQPPLMWAAANGRTAAVAALLAAGARDCATEKNRMSSSFVVAAENGHPEILALFYKTKSSVTPEDKAQAGSDAKESVTGAEEGYALERAANNGHLDVLQLLLQHGVDAKAAVSPNALGAAALQRRFDAAKLLLEHGADPNSPMELYRTPMAAAVAGGDLKVVKLLLEKGGAADGVALRAAAGAGHADVVSLLLDKGVDVNAMEGDRTPLVAAVTGRKTDIVSLLLDRGANPNIGSGFNEPPLVLAAQFGETEMVRHLLKAGARSAARGKDGRTPLMWAAHVGHTETAKVLLDARADAALKDEMGKTALGYAKEKGHGEIVEMLKGN